MTLQLGQLAPDFVQASTATAMTGHHAVTPSLPLADAGLAGAKPLSHGHQDEIVPEAPAGMWGY